MAEYDEHVIRKRIRVYGDVQGVGFRYRAEHAAGLAGATGWVQNEPDGSVLMEIQGTEKQIDEVFVMINRGTYITITGMDAKCITVEENEYGFRRR